MTDELKTKLKDLPTEPGVYFHKSATGEIIYIGKAAVLRNRVRQYFQKSRARDPKTEALIAEIHDTDWMVVDSELEALFLEAELVRRYLPRFNILLRDDKALSYIRIDYDSDHPTVTTTRRPLDDGARYFGPYFSHSGLRIALKYLRRAFPFSVSKTHSGVKGRASLYYHIGLDPGLEEGRTSLEDYRANLNKLISYINGNRVKLVRELEDDMKQASIEQNFELAAKFRNQINALNSLKQKIIFRESENIDISKDHALGELMDLFTLDAAPKRIEGFDISHMSGTDVVASMVVFENGASSKSEYRKFKALTDVNNDFKNMHDTIKRRFSERNIKKWGIPDLVIIDGGKGQLGAAIEALDELDFKGQKIVGLAKQFEQIIVNQKGSNLNANYYSLKKLSGTISHSDDYSTINLPIDSNLIKLFQRIRDESHRFAVSYHTTLKRGRQTTSWLDTVPGIGPKTKKDLLRKFGSVTGVKAASENELIEVIGQAKAKVLIEHQ
jgi:excinuclease ABC subunit C